MRKHVLEEQRIDSFEEWLQYACGVTYHLEDMLNNLDADQIKEEVRLYAIELAKEALKNASENLIEWIYEKYPDFRTARLAIISETNIPKIN